MTKNTDLARRLIGLVDLTRLEAPDENSASEAEAIRSLCSDASTPLGPVAAVCVYPAWVSLAHNQLEAAGQRAAIKLASVANFPSGANSIDSTVAEIAAAVADGADEIDVVIPWSALKDGHSEPVKSLLAASRMACPNRCMKVILESGELEDQEIIRHGAELAIGSGADFIKTSTGKVAVNATLPAARVMLIAIRESERDVGFKASGGIRTTSEAAAYFALAEQIMGRDWINPDHLRFGASSLLDDLLATANNPDSDR